MAVELKNVLRVEDPHGFTYYLGTLYPEQIKELTFVPVVDKSSRAGTTASLNERDEQGYQRNGDASRMNKIKEYFKSHPDRVVPPVLLSARGTWKFSSSRGDKNFGTIVAEDLAAIVDGQHRLGGFWMLVNDPDVPADYRKRPLPFMLIDDMNVEQEQQNFIDVNELQKGVKPSLLGYLRRDATFAGQAAHALMTDQDSVFCGRIARETKEDAALLLFKAMQECVLLTFDRTFVNATGFRPDGSDANRQKAISYLLKYWSLVQSVFATQWSDIENIPSPGEERDKEKHRGTRAFRYRVLEETGIRALSKLASLIFQQSWMKQSSSPGWDKVEELLKKVEKDERARLALTKPNLNPAVEELNPMLRLSGKAGVDAIYDFLQAALNMPSD